MQGILPRADRKREGPSPSLSAEPISAIGNYSEPVPQVEVNVAYVSPCAVVEGLPPFSF